MLPQRSTGSPLQTELPHPPGRMALLRDRRPRKRWTYAGLFSEEMMLCAATVQIGPLPQSFWAVVERDRDRPVLTDGTSFMGRRVGFTGSGAATSVLAVAGGQVAATIALEPDGEPIEVISPHGTSFIWTLKLPVRAEGQVIVGGRARRLDARGLVDISAGYHARSTAWSWSCGVGQDAAGRALAWNIVDGVHDAPQQSERTLWFDGAASELPPASFDAGLQTISFAGDRSELHFTAEAQRARRDNFGLMMSDYCQPFGSFSGSMPGAQLAWGLGVMERHDVRW